MGTPRDSTHTGATAALLMMAFLMACSPAEPADAPGPQPPPPPAQPAEAAPAIPAPSEVEAATRWLAGETVPSTEAAIAEALGAAPGGAVPDEKVRGRQVTYLLPGKDSSPCFLHRTRKTGNKVDVTVRVRKATCDDAQLAEARDSLARACAEVRGKLEAESEWTFGPSGVTKDVSLSCETKGDAAPAAPRGVAFDREHPFEAVVDRWTVQVPSGSSGTAPMRIERWTRVDDQVLWEVSRTTAEAEASEQRFADSIAKIPAAARLADSKTIWVTKVPAAPPAPSDAWVGLDKLRPDQVVSWTVEDPSKFKTGQHGKLVGVVAERCSDAMARAQWRQDTLLQTDSHAHFDNCAFAGSIAYIETLLTEVHAKVGKPNPTADDAVDAMDLLGRALHGIQDFYSHTNWVELKAARNAPYDASLVVPLWTPAGKKEVLDLAAKGDLYSGRVWWGAPRLCAKTVPTHGAMAKDSESDPAGKAPLPAWNRTGYRAAVGVASTATTAFLRDMYTRWPALKTHCGPVVHVLPPLERRADRR